MRINAESQGLEESGGVLLTPPPVPSTHEVWPRCWGEAVGEPQPEGQQADPGNVRKTSSASRAVGLVRARAWPRGASGTLPVNEVDIHMQVVAPSTAQDGCEHQAATNTAVTFTCSRLNSQSMFAEV